MFYTIPHTYQTEDFKDLFSESGTPLWEEVWRNTDVVGVYGNSVIPGWGERAYPDLHAAGRFMTGTDLRRMGAWLWAREMGLCVTAGAVKKEWSLDAVRARKVTQRILKQFHEHDCRTTSLRIDESLYAGYLSGLDPEAVAGLVVENYARPLQQEHPDLQIGVVEPWPACPGAAIESYVIRMGEMYRLPAFIHIDIAYPQFKKRGYVPDLVAALEGISNLGVPIGVIAWSSNFHERPTSDEAFCRNTMDFSAWMHAHFGRFCHDRIVQSWLPFPTRCLPEHEKDTFMWLTREYGRRYVQMWKRAAIGPVV